MDIVTRKQINILIRLAESDKHFSSLERERIFEIAKKHNFPSEEVKDLIRNPEPIESFGALSDNQKFEYLVNSIELMLIDRKIFETEIKFCQNLALKLGFKKDAVDFVQDQIGKLNKDDLKKALFERFA